MGKQKFATVDCILMCELFHCLQPIASKLKFFNSMDPAFARQKQSDASKWERLSHTIQSSLRSAAKKAVKKQLMRQRDAEKYFISGGETKTVVADNFFALFVVISNCSES